MSGAGDKQEIRQRIGSGFAREVQRVPIAAAQKILDSPSPVVGITRARCYLPGEGGNARIKLRRKLEVFRASRGRIRVACRAQLRCGEFGEPRKPYVTHRRIIAKRIE